MSMFADRDQKPGRPTFVPPDLTDHTNPLPQSGGPSAAFIGVSWLALVTGITAFGIGLYNAQLPMTDKGLYLTLLLYGLFAAVAVQKSVRDRLENVPVSMLFYGLAWASVITVITLLTIVLWNADLLRSEKGFYAMAFALSMFAAVAVQKNVRDTAAVESGGRPGSTTWAPPDGP